MKAEQYLRKATRSIYDEQKRREVWEELESCIEDLTQAYVAEGMTPQEAGERAVEQMGEPQDAGIEFHRIYRPKVEWREPLWFLVWAAVIGSINLTGFFVNAARMEEYPQIMRGAGAVLMVFGIVWSVVEKYMDLPFFYAWAKHWGAGGLGGIANAALLGAIGTGIAAGSVRELIAFATAMLVIYQAQYLILSGKREKKEQRYLWEIGAAEEDFEYQGRVKIGGTIQKVRIKKGAAVKKGEALIITGIDGFRLQAENM